jgi:hypothetical protein
MTTPHQDKWTPPAGYEALVHPNPNITFDWETLPELVVDRPTDMSLADWRRCFRRNFDIYLEAVDVHNALVETATQEQREVTLSREEMDHPVKSSDSMPDGTTTRTTPLPSLAKLYKVRCEFVCFIHIIIY